MANAGKYRWECYLMVLQIDIETYNLNASNNNIHSINELTPRLYPHIYEPISFWCVDTIGLGNAQFISTFRKQTASYNWESRRIFIFIYLHIVIVHVKSVERGKVTDWLVSVSFSWRLNLYYVVECTIERTHYIFINRKRYGIFLT